MSERTTYLMKQWRERALATEAEVDDLRARLAKALEFVGHLDLTATQVREQGDVRQVLLDDDGVGQAPSLSDELWAIAFNLRAALANPDAAGEGTGGAG